MSAGFRVGEHLFLDVSREFAGGDVVRRVAQGFDQPSGEYGVSERTAVQHLLVGVSGGENLPCGLFRDGLQVVDVALRRARSRAPRQQSAVAGVNDEVEMARRDCPRDVVAQLRHRDVVDRVVGRAVMRDEVAERTGRGIHRVTMPREKNENRIILRDTLRERRH